MLPSWCNDAVTVSRAPLVAVRGTYERDWSQAVPRTVRGCSLQPSATSTAFSDPREAAQYDAVLFAPYGSDIAHGDRVDFRGRSYLVDGVALPWRSPTGAVSHMQANLVGWEG